MGQKLEGDFFEEPEEEKIRLMMTCTLPTEEDAIKFMRASEDIELNIDCTKVKMVNFADYKVGEPPPPTPINNMNEDWDLMGVIYGPYAEDVPDSHLEAHQTQWAQQVISILEEYGLVQEDEEFH